MSLQQALDDEDFLGELVGTLRAWGIGVRASKLVPFPEFVGELRRWRGPLTRLEHIQISTADDSVGDQLWNLIEGLAIVENRARVVALSKTLHHLLPDLIPPIDREYTGRFFGWHIPEFQTAQREIFETAWDAFRSVARQVDLDAHVGTAEWNTSPTKVIDNAIIGFCLQELNQAKPGQQRTSKPTESQPRRTSWTIEELEADLKTFGEELTSAGLKENSVNTYVGRAATFIRWLDGRYEPRG